MKAVVATISCRTYLQRKTFMKKKRTGDLTITTVIIFKEMMVKCKTIKHSSEIKKIPLVIKYKVLK